MGKEYCVAAAAGNEAPADMGSLELAKHLNKVLRTWLGESAAPPPIDNASLASLEEAVQLRTFWRTSMWAVPFVWITICWGLLVGRFTGAYFPESLTRISATCWLAIFTVTFTILAIVTEDYKLWSAIAALVMAPTPSRTSLASPGIPCARRTRPSCATTGRRGDQPGNGVPAVLRRGRACSKAAEDEGGPALRKGAGKVVWGTEGAEGAAPAFTPEDIDGVELAYRLNLFWRYCLCFPWMWVLYGPGTLLGAFTAAYLQGSFMRLSGLGWAACVTAAGGIYIATEYGGYQTCTAIIVAVSVPWLVFKDMGGFLRDTVHKEDVGHMRKHLPVLDRVLAAYGVFVDYVVRQAQGKPVYVPSEHQLRRARDSLKWRLSWAEGKRFMGPLT